jgi:hypothetical protein
MGTQRGVTARTACAAGTYLQCRVGSEELSTALPTPDKAGATNDDMMILVVTIIL